MQQVSDSGELNWHLRYRTSSCCLPLRPTWSALPNGDFGAQYCACGTSRLVGVHSPANALPRHHWSSTHSSGSERIATPYSVRDFHPLLHASFRRRFQDVPEFTQYVQHDHVKDNGKGARACMDEKDLKDPSKADQRASCMAKRIRATSPRIRRKRCRVNNGIMASVEG